MAKDDITIRVLNTETQKIKFLFPSIANNKQLMKNMKCVISDPQYEAKMEAFKSKKPFSENGQTSNPAQESFSPNVIEPIKNEPISQPKDEMSAPAIKVKRTRRTKAEMLADKQSKKQLA